MTKEIIITLCFIGVLAVIIGFYIDNLIYKNKIKEHVFINFINPFKEKLNYFLYLNGIPEPAKIDSYIYTSNNFKDVKEIKYTIKWKGYIFIDEIQIKKDISEYDIDIFHQEDETIVNLTKSYVSRET